MIFDIIALTTAYQKRKRPLIRIPKRALLASAGLNKVGRNGGDTLSFAYHSTPKPPRWYEWPAVPTETKHVTKKSCFVSPGKSDISDPHLRTLALQVYRDMMPVLHRRVDYPELSELIFKRASTEILQWNHAGKVVFPHSGTASSETDSSQCWIRITDNEAADIVDAPLIMNVLGTDAAKVWPTSLISETDWLSSTTPCRLIFAAFPTARYLSRVVCHSRVIIGVLCGQGRLAWTSPELFYSGVDVVKGKNRRHGVDVDFVDSKSHRDFHRVDLVRAGMCLYVRSGAVIQLCVEANTMLVMCVDEEEDGPKFERLSEWLVRVKGQ